jgi:rRNA-processing protein EBP2
VEVKQKREKQKKEDLDAIKQWRKTGRDGENDAELFPEALLDSSSTLRKEIRDRQVMQQGDRPRPNKKRQYKDKKFGHGGVKRTKKNNDTTSASDISQWNTKLNKTLPPGMAKGLKKAKRPGKAVRQQRGNK